ncbi:hypothetical protein [Isoptericola sp. BMS4]|uniref:hypothetical protein n=1 Tax=Isoptericola sp. BMS4 TaxID=2527875 RepID=UPI001420E2AF|nr:hypothetical protein [Isoptericola sp. BMS4]
MPMVRIELRATDRAEAQRVVRAYADGGRHRPSDDAALDEVARLGRTPAGRPRCVGMTNGQPTYLKFDVEVYPEVAG